MNWMSVTFTVLLFIRNVFFEMTAVNPAQAVFIDASVYVAG